MTERMPVGIYPFQAELLPLVRNFEALQEKYALEKVMAFQGSGLIGRDVGYACNQPDIGAIIESFDENKLKDIEKLIISKPLNCSIDDEKILIKVAKQAVGKGIFIDFYADSTDEFVNMVNPLRKEHPLLVRLINEDMPLEETDFKFGKKYQKLNVPILLVGGLVENPDTTEIVCYLKKRFEMQGLRCLTYGKNPIMSLLGFHSITTLLKMNNFSEVQRIENINQLVNAHVEKYFPDLIIAESPDAVIKFNDTTPNGFGVLSYMLGQAFQPDFFICSIPYELSAREMTEFLRKDFEIRLNSRLVAVQASNIVIDSAENHQTHSMSYVSVPMSFVETKISENYEREIPVFNIIAKEESLFSYLKDFLNINDLRG